MRYWDNICKKQQEQTAKGILHYGKTLEENKTPDIIERINMAEEEAIDFLMYLEWVKESLENGAHNECVSDNN